MTLRYAKRKLTGRSYGYGAPDIRLGEHVKGGPAVTMDLMGFNGTRTFIDPEELDRLASDVEDAMDWLRRQLKENVSNAFQ